ncbi:MAG: hypothetical protein GXO69_04400 [Acidobacteria bacterium]|nr:hypothetical protein [Acidobacteriota bacterium]
MNVTKYFRLIAPVLIFCICGWPLAVHADSKGVGGRLQAAVINGLKAETTVEQQKAVHEIRRSMDEGGYQVFPFSDDLFSPAVHGGSESAVKKALQEWNPEWKRGRFAGIDRLILAGQLKPVLGELSKGFSTVLKDPLNMVRLLLSGFEGLYLLGMIFFGIFGVIALIKYGRNFHHDISRFLEARISSEFLRVMASSLLYLLPVLFTVPAKYLPIYWGLLFSPYFSRNEKIAFSLNVGLVLIFLAGFMYAAKVGNQVSSPEFLYYRSLEMPFSQVEGFNPEPRLELFSKATNRMRRGQFSEAISFYKEIDSSSYLYPFALNNIGVAYFHLKEFELSRDFFREAAQKSGNLKTPGYNLAVVMLSTYNLAESSSELKSVYEKSPNRVISNLLEQIRYPVPMIEVPGAAFLYGKLFTLHFQKGVIPGGDSGEKEMVFVVLIFLIFLLLGFIFRDRDISESCSRCGKPFRFLESHNDKMCKQCVTVFVKKENLDSGKRMAKVESIRKYNRIRKIIQGTIGLLIPGTYNIFVNETGVRGVFSYFLFSGCLLLSRSELKLLGSWFLAVPFLLVIVFILVINIFGIVPELGED